MVQVHPVVHHTVFLTQSSRKAGVLVYKAHHALFPACVPTNETKTQYLFLRKYIFFYFSNLVNCGELKTCYTY